MAKAPVKEKPELLLDIRNLRIEARVYPPGEAPKDITLVHDVSLTLKRGKVLGLIGESGAGKSTIGLSSMGYGRGGVRITGGEVILNGRDILKGGKQGFRQLRGKEVCYVAQSAAAAFNPAHRLMDQVVEASLLHGAGSRAEAEKRAVDSECTTPNPRGSQAASWALEMFGLVLVPLKNGCARRDEVTPSSWSTSQLRAGPVPA